MVSQKTQSFWDVFKAKVFIGVITILLFAVMLFIVAVIATLFQIGQWVLGIIAIIVVLLGVAALFAWMDS